MTDLKPEDRALKEAETILAGKLSNFPDHGAADGVAIYNVRLNGAQLSALLQAARAEGPRTDCYECGTHDVIGPICAQCNPDLAAMVRGDSLSGPTGEVGGVGGLSAALTKAGYLMSEPHLSGHRVILGFDTLDDAQAVHVGIADVILRARAAPPSREA